MVRHLVGAGIGLVAVPVLLLLSYWAQREQALFTASFDRAHGVLFLVALLLVGVFGGVLCGGRLVSPVASLVSGGLLFLLSVLYRVPFALALHSPVGLDGFLGRAAGYLPTLLVVSLVLVVASVWPSRWLGSALGMPKPHPFPAPEVRP